MKNFNLLTLNSGIYYYNLNDKDLEADINMPDYEKVKDGLLVVNKSSSWTNFLFVSYNGGIAIGQRFNSEETISWVYK